MPDWLLPANVTPAIFLLLVVISFFTSALTAAFGIGGGVAMLGALAGTVPTATVVAVHAVVQLGSNFGRVVIQRHHILWREAAIFTVGSCLGRRGRRSRLRRASGEGAARLLGAFILLLTGCRSHAFRA